MLELVGFDPLWKVIDPACGEGVFLMRATERGCGTAVGVDIDPEALKRAQYLLNGKVSSVKLFCQDGLDPIQSENVFWQGNYDLVIGNPPFAGTGYRIRDLRVLSRFELSKVRMNPEQNGSIEQGVLFDFPIEAKRQKPSQAIEVLFLERFVQLCKPNGKICVILPEGVFTNSSLRQVREWMVSNFQVRAIIGLPRETFRSVGTTAKTVILYLQNCPPTEHNQTFLAEITQADWDSGLNADGNAQLIRILELFCKFWENPSN